jgi:hypothetical protein
LEEAAGKREFQIPLYKIWIIPGFRRRENRYFKSRCDIIEKMNGKERKTTWNLRNYR